MFYRPRQFVPRFARRLVCALAMFSLVVGAIGVPLTRLPHKDLSQPFPCQDHHCGCASAPQCWLDCCCYSADQKLAWARRHGVAPPDHLVRSAAFDPPPTAAAPHDGRLATSAGTGKSCCAGQESPGDCREINLLQVCHAEEAAAPSERVPVMLTAYQKCRGIPPTLATLGSFVCDAAGGEPWRLSVTDRMQLETTAAASPLLPPPTPPPKLAAAFASAAGSVSTRS